MTQMLNIGCEHSHPEIYSNSHRDKSVVPQVLAFRVGFTRSPSCLVTFGRVTLEKVTNTSEMRILVNLVIW